MKAEEDSKGGGDPLKYYCLVFGLLIVVIGFVYMKQRSQLKAYEEENRFAERLMADAGAASAEPGDRPNNFTELSLAVERMLGSYANAVGVGGDTRGFVTSVIENRATAAGITIKNFGNERTDPYLSKGYEQTERELTLEATDLDALTHMLYNLEASTRYRVFELAWRSKPANENALPPHHAVTGPVIKLGFRRPIAATGQ